MALQVADTWQQMQKISYKQAVLYRSHYQHCNGAIKSVNALSKAAEENQERNKIQETKHKQKCLSIYFQSIFQNYPVESGK